MAPFLLRQARMSWQRRLQEIALAGGAITLGSCSILGDDGGFHAPCGNANPDPCICGRPERDPGAKILCDQKMACEAQGGTWTPFPAPAVTDAGTGATNCQLPQDGGVPDAQ
jgi:hypothetical protein